MRHRIPLIATALLVGAALGIPNPAGAAATGWPMQAMQPDLRDLPSLQRGFKLYVNYCLGCHSLRFQRYERTADDLGIPHDAALENLVFTGQKIGELMTTAMATEQARNWFGGPAPDLTMVTRVRSPEWTYNYLRTFYVDEARPFGVNNKVFENVGMPHVMLDLQGVQRDLCAAGADDCFELAVDEGTGLYSGKEYDAAVYDLVNFLFYVGEPTRLERQQLGIYVLLFIVVLGVFTWMLNREFWKDVH